MFVDGDASGRVRVKICGITNAADAEAAINAGADALGLNFYRGSSRCIDLATASEWLLRLPTAIRKVAVLVNPTLEEAIAAVSLPFISSLQLHGSESPEFCARLAEAGVAFAKALPVQHVASLLNIPIYATDVFVLDSATAHSFGGSGKTFPWNLARVFVREHPEFQVILAGGLSPENVGGAIAAVRPFAVDVTSGVESRAGQKDHARVRAFIEAARSA